MPLKVKKSCNLQANASSSNKNNTDDRNYSTLFLLVYYCMENQCICSPELHCVQVQGCNLLHTPCQWLVPTIAIPLGSNAPQSLSRTSGTPPQTLSTCSQPSSLWALQLPHLSEYLISVGSPAGQGLYFGLVSHLGYVFVSFLFSLCVLLFSMFHPLKQKIK